MDFVRTERDALCCSLRQAGPQAPTLCSGWTTHDLAAHLWLRENDPLATSGLVIGALAATTERRMALTKARWSYADLLSRIQAGPPRWSLFAIPGMDEQANTIEYFVHHEDVRRAGPSPAEPRSLEAATQEAMWKRLRLMGRALLRRSPIGIVFERTDVTGAEPIRVMPGNPVVTIIGQPSELVLYAYGRRRRAHVRVIGDDGALTQLSALDLSV